MNIIAEFEKEYIHAIQQGTAAIFAGAGLGKSAGYADWKNLLRSIANQIGLDVDKETDLIEVAQFYKNEIGSRGNINSRILNEFSKEPANTEVAALLASIPIDTYWTTNYDSLIEDELRKANRVVMTVHTPESLAVSLDNPGAIVYKMHGDYSDPAHCVITKDDYETYDRTRHAFSTTLQGHLITKTFLFVGFSFDDPNLKYIFSRMRALMGEHIRTHYCFFEKEHWYKGQKRIDYEYRVKRQQLRINDMKRYGIQAVLLDSYSQIPGILEHIKLQAKCKNVFISGAASTYGQHWGKTGIQFINLLTQLLYDEDYRIVTGHAIGVGSYIVQTVLENVQSNSHLLESHLLIRAFPYEAKNSPNYTRLKKEYRESIASVSGISIFIFGNKESENGDIILSDGMMEEFEAAKMAKNFIIPVGSTGFVAEQIYNEVVNTKEKYPYLSAKNLKILKECRDPIKLVDQIRAILDNIKAIK